MYNNIGLATPRGSGTSGYVNANKARVRKQKSRLDFIKEMKALRENILPPPRKANQDILDHNRKRLIYVKLAELREELSKPEKGLTEEQIEETIKKEEKAMLEKVQKGEDIFAEPKAVQAKDSHALAVAKEKQFSKLKNAFQIDEGYEFGSAFDFEQQEKKRLERLYEKELKKLEKVKDRDRKVKDKKRKEKKILEEKKAEKKKKKKKKKRKRSSSSDSDSD